MQAENYDFNEICGQWSHISSEIWSDFHTSSSSSSGSAVRFLVDLAVSFLAVVFLAVFVVAFAAVLPLAAALPLTAAKNSFSVQIWVPNFGNTINKQHLN